MLCPKCSQQLPDSNRFCPKCGFALDLIKNLPADDSSPQANSPQIQQNGPTAYQKGIRQGFQLILLSLVLVPAYILLAALFPANDVLVESAPSDTAFEKISQAILATLLMVGLARMTYAYIFERGRKEAPPNPISPDSGKLLFSSPGAYLEMEKAKTAELVEPEESTEQEADRIKRR